MILTIIHQQLNIKMETQYVYLLQTREFFNSKQPVYKIGRTKKHNLTRFSQYTLGSVLLFQSSCRDCYKLEREIITLFKQKYIHKHLIGRESFEGDADEMIQDLCDIIKYERKTSVLIVDNIESTQEVVVEENDGNEVIQVDNENNIINAFVKEYLQGIVEENIPDAVENENIQAFVEEIDIIIEDVEEDVENDNVIIEDVEEDVEEDVQGESIVNKKKSSKFCCDVCNYSTWIKSNFQSHMNSKKHALKETPPLIDPENPPNFQCKVCNNCYKSHSGMWKHSQTCKAVELRVVPKIVPLDLHTKIEKLERVIGKLTSLVENNLTRQT